MTTIRGARVEQRRRTQQERREETIARLLDAALSTLFDLGYARTTVKEICDRAGLSQGALFRHFRTRKAVLIATAQRISERQIEEFSARFGDFEPTPDVVLEALRHLRTIARGRSNLVWQELIGAARTDPELRAEMGPALSVLHARESQAARDLIGHLFEDEDDLLALVQIIVNYLDAEAGMAIVLPDAGRDDCALRMLARLVLTQHPDARPSFPDPFPAPLPEQFPEVT